jgi:hypothetical protein
VNVVANKMPAEAGREANKSDTAARRSRRFSPAKTGEKNQKQTP